MKLGWMFTRAGMDLKNYCYLQYKASNLGTLMHSKSSQICDGAIHNNGQPLYGCLLLDEKVYDWLI